MKKTKKQILDTQARLYMFNEGTTFTQISGHFEHLSEAGDFDTVTATKILMLAISILTNQPKKHVRINGEDYLCTDIVPIFASMVGNILQNPRMSGMSVGCSPMFQNAIRVATDYYHARTVRCMRGLAR